MKNTVFMLYSSLFHKVFAKPKDILYNGMVSIRRRNMSLPEDKNNGPDRNKGNGPKNKRTLLVVIICLLIRLLLWRCSVML